MNKYLIIAKSVNDISKFKELYSKDCDILALTQDVMYILNNLQLDYMVIEDYYDEKHYFNDREAFNINVDDFFNKLDKACEGQTDFPYSYSGNEGYFLTWLDDLLYLDKLIEIIKSSYQKIYLFSETKPLKFSEDLLTISELNSNKINGTISLPNERSIEKKLQIIFDVIDINHIEDTKSSSQRIPIFKNLKFFMNRAEGFIKRRLKTQIEVKKKNTYHQDANIYIVQGGYEVLYLKKYLPKYNYLNPFTKLRKEIISYNPEKIETSVIDNFLKEFIFENFENIGNYVDLIFHSYHSEIIGRVKFFKKNLEHELKITKPDLMLFSTGIRDVFDMIVGYVGNKYNIPLVFFQHGGHSEHTFKSTFNPYKKCVENNSKISKTLIIHSQYELQCLKDYEHSVLALGSISRYEMLNFNSKFKQSEKILFCLGPDVNFNFRQLLNFYSSNKKYNASSDVLSLVSDQSLSLDIKLHPAGEVNSYFFYKKLIHENKYKNINPIYGNFGELIARKYKIIIFDYLASALVNFILALNICVIIYNQDFEKLLINEEVKEDLRQRCYIAKNKKELEYLLIQYKKGKLQSKWSDYFINKYVFPLDNSNPGVEIANYINSIVKAPN